MDNPKTEKGIDVSHWQEEIDWKRVADCNVKHVCIKMSEGGSYTDPCFVENWNGAKAAGINVHCYHYFRALGTTPEEQLENMRNNVETVDFVPGKNVLVVDVEQRGNENATPTQMSDNLARLLELVQNDVVLKCVPMIYTGWKFWDMAVKWTDYDFSEFPLWIAHWDVDTPTLPQTWSQAGKSWTWWQYTSKGKVDGIDSDAVDLNWVRTTE